jgi:hypothetical protein
LVDYLRSIFADNPDSSRRERTSIRLSSQGAVEGQADQCPGGYPLTGESPLLEKAERPRQFHRQTAAWLTFAYSGFWPVAPTRLQPGPVLWNDRSRKDTGNPIIEVPQCRPLPTLLRVTDTSLVSAPDDPLKTSAAPQSGYPAAAEPTFAA